MTFGKCYIPFMKALFCLIMALQLAAISATDAKISRSRLLPDDLDQELAKARQLRDNGRLVEAAALIEKRIAADSSLIPQAATIVGGNYHLVRLTSNIFPDRVGNFSPSDDKLAFARDTFFVRFDDGLFDWLEQRHTQVGYFDFGTNSELMARPGGAEGFNPQFYTDSSLFYITGGDESQDSASANQLMLYDIGTGTSSKCFPLNTYYYCPVEGGVIFYDANEAAIVKKSIDGSIQKTLYDNVGFMHYRRSLSLIRNFSAADDIIMFQAGLSPMATTLYGLSPAGGAVRIMLDRKLVFKEESDCCPAAIDTTDFCYLHLDKNDWDVFYHTPQQDYRLTFDGGEKLHLAVSRNCLMIAYSYRPAGSPTDESEIYILDFGRDATTTDMIYRFKYIN